MVAKTNPPVEGLIYPKVILDVVENVVLLRTRSDSSILDFTL